MNVSLRTRFALIIGGLVVVILALFAGAFLFMEQRHINTQQEKIQKTQAEQVAHACVQARINHDEMALLMLFKDLKQAPGFMEAMCLDGDGRVTLHSGLGRLGQQPVGPRLPSETMKTTALSDGRPLWAYVSPAKGGRIPGGARIVFDPAPVRKDSQKALWGTLTRLSAAAVAILVLVFFLSWATAKTLTDPIHRLAAGARQLGKGHWDTRVETAAPGELGVLALEFNSMSEKLGELDRLKDQFVHAVSHDLRNPLGAIMASAKMLRHDKVPEGSKTLIEVIETGVTRLSAMVNNILDVACLQERTLTFTFRPFPLDPMLRELVRLYQPLAMETNKSVRIDVSPHLPLLQADEEKVFRIFLNLLANAMKFTRAGDVITLSAKTLPDQGMECRVADSGPGIAADRLKTIFQPFHSKSGASTIDVIKQQGSGLGLSLVKALVEGHGGRIRAESAPGQGAAFIFTFPGREP
jgi:signal transduction histidine kinase